MTDEAYAVPLHELLASVPRGTRLEITDPDGMGTRFIPVGRYCHEAAAELRRLHEENLQWQEKCNTYIELHDAVVKDSDRLYALNAELVEALGAVIRGVPDTWEGVVRAKAVLRKAQGDNNEY